VHPELVSGVSPVQVQLEEHSKLSTYKFFVGAFFARLVSASRTCFGCVAASSPTGGLSKLSTYKFFVGAFFWARLVSASRTCFGCVAGSSTAGGLFKPSTYRFIVGAFFLLSWLAQPVQVFKMNWLNHC